MNRKQRRRGVKEQRKHLADLGLTDNLKELPEDKWPSDLAKNRTRVLLSKKYMVQVFVEKGDIIRLSINRVAFNGQSWDDKLSWDEIQDIKDEAGYENHDAVEIYPRRQDIVNVANMRHIFVLPHIIDFAWRNKHGI